MRQEWYCYGHRRSRRCCFVYVRPVVLRCGEAPLIFAVLCCVLCVLCAEVLILFFSTGDLCRYTCTALHTCPMWCCGARFTL